MKERKLHKSSNAFRDLGKFVILNLAIALILNISFYPKLFLSFAGIWSLKKDLLFSFLMSMSLSYGGFLIDGYYDQRISWIKTPLKRLLITAITYLSYSFVISFILVTAYVLISVPEVNWSNISWTRMLQNTLMPTTVALIIISLFVARSWLFEWRNAALETERLKSAMLSSQNQSLKDQLNPHFLFNSLNTLSNLVYESPEKSSAFIQQLSKIYRYVLDVQQEELVKLSEEIGFAKSYLDLQKIRFDQNLIFQIQIDEKETSNAYLPPLSLQLILENAIKHNIISQEKPLKIDIKLKDKHLIITNNYQIKQTTDTESKGIGLENIKRRYHLLSNKKPKIIQDENQFRVELPLLEVDKVENET